MDAPLFTTKDIEKLFDAKLIVVIGDSVQRSVYKDLVCLLNVNRLLKLEELKEKGEESFQGDTLLEGGVKTGLHNGTNYREVRKFMHGSTVVMFYFVTRCYNDYMQSILDEFKLEPPHVIIMNSCLWDLHRYGKMANQEFISNISELMESIDLAVPYEDRLFIWNATLPVREKVKAGFLPPGVVETLPAEDIRKANLFVRDELKEYAKRFLFLDLHRVFYRHLDRRVKDGVHWDDFSHRKITCLLLAEISRCWNREVPLAKLKPPISSKPPFLLKAPFLSKAPFSSNAFREIPHVNFLQRPSYAMPPPAIVRPYQLRGWCNGPAFQNRGYPGPRPVVRYPLMNTTFPPFGRKRKHVEENEIVNNYKHPRKFM